MGAGVLILYIIGLIILMLSPIAYLGLKKIGYKTAGIVTAAILALIVLVPSFFMVFESQLYTKSEAEKVLNGIGINLKNDFKMVKNEIVGMPEYYQTTDLLISSSDRMKIIEEIKNANNFQIIETGNILLDSIKRKASGKMVWNYSINDSFVRESYEKEDGYVPISVKVTLEMESDTLELKKIMD